MWAPQGISHCMNSYIWGPPRSYRWYICSGGGNAENTGKPRAQKILEQLNECLTWIEIVWTHLTWVEHAAKLGALLLRARSSHMIQILFACNHSKLSSLSLSRSLSLHLSHFFFLSLSIYLFLSLFPSFSPTIYFSLSLLLSLLLYLPLFLSLSPSLLLPLPISICLLYLSLSFPTRIVLPCNPQTRIGHFRNGLPLHVPVSGLLADDE